MSSLRDDLYSWIAQGVLRPADAPQALALAGLTPGAGEWRGFLRALLLWAGVVLVAAGVIFFFAYNWQDLGRLQKLGLAGTLLGCTVLAAAVLGPDRPGGKAALLGSSLFTGALMALFGQIYQTGADPFELFAYWALLILPWVFIGRMGALWLFWIVLLNVAALTYMQARSWIGPGLLFGLWGMTWVVLGLNVTALVVWEFLMASGVGWLERWGARTLGFAAGGVATFVGVLAVVESNELGPMAFPVYVAWAGAMYWAYRVRLVDVFMLAGLVLSGIVTVTALLSRWLLDHSDAGGLLLIGMVIIGLSAAGGWWIRQVLRE